MAFRPDLDDFGVFYERSYQGAYRTALAIVRDASLAADVAQDAFVSAYRQRDRFRGDAPGQAWLHRIVVNEAISACRRRRPIVREFDMSRLDGRDDLRGASDRILLLGALESLTPTHRAAVVLRYYHGYDYAAIAGMLGTTSTNVGAMLSRSLDRLKVALDEGDRSALPSEVAHGR